VALLARTSARMVMSMFRMVGLPLDRGFGNAPDATGA
jgi:hypothetical protein